MKSKVHSITAAMLLLASFLTDFARAEDRPAPARERIGIYDSRAIAVAYGGSKYLKQELQDLTAKHKKATDAGDAKETTRLEAEGQAAQAKLHKQAFSTAPVNDLLVHISSALPKIQEAAGVTAIVSK